MAKFDLNDDGVVDPGLLDEGNVVFERGWFGLIGGLRMEGKLLRVGGKEVYMSVYSN